MQGILERAESKKTHFAIKITNVGSGGAHLYILNGGTRPHTPRLGDFAYDFVASTIQIYEERFWRNVTTSDMRSRIWNPVRNGSAMMFTDRGIPYWDLPDEDEEDAEFETVEQILDRFKLKCEVCKVQISECIGESTTEQSSHKRAREDATQAEYPEASEAGPSSKRLRVFEGTQTNKQRKDKSQTRFIESAIGFPSGTRHVQWEGGFQTYAPFAGIGTKDNFEGSVVEELARRTALETALSKETACGDTEDAFRIGELVVELEVPNALREPESADSRLLANVWRDFMEDIERHISNSTSVVIRRWSDDLHLTFSNLAMHIGTLGMRVEWSDGCVIAQNRSKRIKDEYHRISTMSKFLELTEDTTICGNFLDGKDMNTGTPTWARPLMQSTLAWEQTMHLQFTQEASKKSEADPPINICKSSPEVIRSGTWTAQGWRLVTHPGYLTPPHYDCCGFGTWVRGEYGAKIWTIMRPKRGACPRSLGKLCDTLGKAGELSKNQRFTRADVATVCLEAGDIMFQPPAVLHTVYTPVPSVFSGGYFFNYQTMHLSRAVMTMPNLDKKSSITNDHRIGVLRTLCRMLIALRYRSEPRVIGKRSLLSLILIIIKSKNPEKTSCRYKNQLAEEERGELAFGKLCATHLLRWIGMTEAEAEEWVKSSVYYSAGESVLKIPALAEGEVDNIFPSMNGIF